MSDYTISTSPDLDDAYKSFFETFYEFSDMHPSDGGTAAKYASNFTPDATFILSGAVSKGTQEIIRKREAMWEVVTARKHKPTQIFTFGKGSNEVMIHGTVQSTPKNGQTVEKAWAAKAEMAKGDNGEVKMKFYQIYI